MWKPRRNGPRSPCNKRSVNPIVINTSQFCIPVRCYRIGKIHCDDRINCCCCCCWKPLETKRIEAVRCLQWQKAEFKRRKDFGLDTACILRPPILRQRTLNKTAINKDEVRIRTVDSLNQIRDIKVPSKAEEKRTRRRKGG